MSDALKLNPDKAVLELYKYVKSQITDIEVRAGARNLKDAPDTLIYCNNAAPVADLGGYGEVLLRVEIINRKQNNGNEQLETLRKADTSVVRWGNIDLYEIALNAFDEAFKDNKSQVIGNYALCVDEVIKDHTDEFSYIWIMFNTVINY